MSTLPATTEQHYLTGTSAMAIPSNGTDFVDWHFVDSFINGRAQFRIAGVNFPDTTPVLALSGVRECSDVLRRAGLPLEKTKRFYAADRDRALLDLLLFNLASHRRPDHLRLQDFFECEIEQAGFELKLETLSRSLQNPLERSLLEEWRRQQ
jgi:hypothetical protein